MNKDQFTELISNLEKELRSNEIDYTDFQVALVLNSQTDKVQRNKEYVTYIKEIESFSPDELITIFNSIQRMGVYVDILYDELSFTENYFNNKYTKDKLLVFNLSRNGNGRTKKTYLSSFCEFYSIKYTSSDSFSISMFRNKFLYTMVLKSMNIDVPESYLIRNGQLQSVVESNSQKKYIIKLNNESASQGINENSISTDVDSLINSLSDTSKDYLLQEFIEGREIEVPFIIDKHNKVNILGYIGLSMDNEEILGERILTEEISMYNKYNFYDVEESIKDIKNKIDLAIQTTVDSIGFKNYGRIDFRISNEGVAYITDISTTPYLTEHSSFAFAMKKIDLSLELLFKYIVLNSIS